MKNLLQDQLRSFAIADVISTIQPPLSFVKQEDWAQQEKNLKYVTQGKPIFYLNPVKN